MSRALLDVNVLIALLDPNHVFHGRVHEWWRSDRGRGWASCPLTENGVIRILSQPSYSPGMQLPPRQIATLMADFKERTDHEFWPDSLSLTDQDCFDFRFLTGHRQVTDTYLLALAVKNGGALVTFDRSVNPAAVKMAAGNHLLVLQG